MPSFAILGARNLGGAIADRLLAEGRQGAAIARSDDTLEAVRARGMTALRADVMEPAQLAAALGQLEGRVDLIVNAVSVARFDPDVPWGGGPLVDADVDRWEAWGAAVARQAFVFFSESARFLTRQGGPAKVIQVGNSATREAASGLGLWAAGWHGVRALTSAARQELAGAGIQVALVAVLGPIASPKTERMVANLPPDAVNQQDDVAAEIAAFAAFAAGELDAELAISPTRDRPRV